MVMQHGIVLAHGYLGFGQIGALEYFRGVKEHLESRGYRALSPTVDPNGSIQERAASLEAQIRAGFGGEPVHVIAHSMGGLDARYLLQPRGGTPTTLIASLTTLCTPHRGTFLATIACQADDPVRLLENPKFLTAMAELPLLEAQLTAQFAAHMMTHPFSDFAALEAVLTEAKDLLMHAVGNNFAPLSTYLRELFATHDSALADLAPGTDLRLFEPGMPAVPCFSYTAKAELFASLSPELIFSNLILSAAEGDNDGLVADSAASWGQFMTCFPADHIGVVGWGNDQHLQWFDEMVHNIEQL